MRERKEGKYKNNFVPSPCHLKGALHETTNHTWVRIVGEDECTSGEAALSGCIIINYLHEA